jgi:hypothetical protein
MQNILPIIGSLVAASGTVPYVIATIKKQTKPRLVTWFTWFLLTTLASAAAFSDHQFAAGFFALLGALSTGAAALAGLRYGERDFTKLDIGCVFGVAAGFALWLIFKDAAIGVWAAIIIDFIGLVPTLRHAWVAPQEETALTYALVGIGGALTVAAILIAGHITVTSIGYPLYAGLSLGITSIAIVLRRRTLAPAVEAAE